MIYEMTKEKIIKVLQTITVCNDDFERSALSTALDLIETSDKVCKLDCIHYGKTHPCVLCTRDIANRDYYEKDKMNG